MTDSLRDRIAAVLATTFDRIADGDLVGFDEMADALIAALGLREENMTQAAMWGDSILNEVYPNSTRYVTQWTPDE